MAQTNETTRRFCGESEAPRQACIFADRGVIRFAAGEPTEEDRFEIEAYDGKVIPNHWFWGNLAFDLEGLSFASDPLPVLDSHGTSSRIGFTTKQQIGRKVTFEGRFLDNPVATDLRRDLKKGFPMQASLSFEPQVIERVAEGASVRVNGHALKGPGAVFRKARIDEVSMCVFGAVPGTRSAAFAEADRQRVQFSVIGKDITMGNENVATALTAESLQTEHPAVHQAVFEAGRVAGGEAEKTRFRALQEACGEDRELLTTAFVEGRDVAWALKEANTRLAARLKETQTKLSAARSGESRAADRGARADRATQEFIEQPRPGATAAQFDESTATDDELKAHFAATPGLRKEFTQVETYLTAVHLERDGG